MSVADSLWALVIATAACYGLGLPLAWLLPAPQASPWVYRLAIAPVLSIVAATLFAWALRALGIPLQPLQLVGLGVGAWLLALRVGRGRWPPVRFSDVWPPLAIVATSAVVWLVSLAGFGLYLPNRDFKNHAYWVAQVAFLQSSDPADVLAFSPVSGVESGVFYPLGLHTLLGWALPSPSWNSVGVTAAATCVVTSVSLPLAMMALARFWDVSSRTLWGLAGMAGAGFAGFTSGFEIGSVVLLVGTALFTAALVTLWQFLEEPDAASVASLGIVSLGLMFVHIAEAVGLFIVALVAVVARRTWKRVAFSWPLLAALTAPAAAGVLFLADSASELQTRGSADWDIAPNTVSPLAAWTVPLLVQPGGPAPLQFAWICLTLGGVWMAYRSRMDTLPLIVLGVALVLSFFASARGVPAWLGLITAPWYGTPSRIALLAAPAIALLGSLPIARMIEAPGSRVIRVVGVCGVALMVGLSAGVTPMRRADLRNALAGAGDTVDVARSLADVVRPGQTILNFDGDGTANLFAFGRAPILDGYRIGTAAGNPEESPIDFLQSRLLQLSDPEVRARMAELGVAFIAVGTTSRYWDAEVGYPWQRLVAQREVEPFLVGTDMVILRYVGTP